MYGRNIKTFKIKTTKINGVEEKYSFKCKGDDIYTWAITFFNLYAKIKWPNFNKELNSEYGLTKEKIKENQKKFLQLISDFISDINISGNKYFINNVEANNATEIVGHYNKNYFYVDKGDIVSVETPNFKEISLESRYSFEKNLLNANFYLVANIWGSSRLSRYLEDKRFVAHLEELMEKMTHKFKYTNDKSLKDKLLTNPLLEDINSLRNEYIKEELLKTINNIDLSITEYSKIDDLVMIAKEIDKLNDSDNYNISTVSYFEDYLANNMYLTKQYLDSVSKKELFEIINYRKTHDLYNAGELEAKMVGRFLQNNFKEITDLFLENSISSKLKKER